MRQQLIQLRQKMQEQGFDAYIVPTADFHGSEYINDYFQCRQFVSGFTGSAGILLVTRDKAKLWTDGRYFLQAAAQLAGSGIDLMKMGQEGVPTMIEYLESVLGDESILGFDGRIVSNTFGSELAAKFKVSHKTDLVDQIWADRPQIMPSKIYPLPDDVTGESAASKLARLRQFMASKDADYHLITQLEDIAWLYNLRGDDIPHTPVFFAFALITATEDRLYVMDESFDGGLPYLQIFDDLKNLQPGTMLLNEDIITYTMRRTLPDHIKVISEENPTTLMKTLKNNTEIKATKNAHLKDGAAMAEFLYWLKSNIGRIEISEISAADYLKNCRSKQDGFMDLSFDTISGYAGNGAIVHYDPTPETNKILEPHGFLLVDSGGQYTDGTTDITRTIALGPLTDEMKEHYTAVLRGHINLATAKFIAGTTGADLDKLARKPLQDLDLDYNHGTGHGVGHLLSCHEGPQSISPRGTKYAIQPGMINSDEPGVYIEDSHGIRLENEILCVEDTIGRLGFESITFCPFEPEAILVERMTADELTWLNNYHKTVYEKISPLVSEEVRAWLKDVTKEI